MLKVQELEQSIPYDFHRWEPELVNLPDRKIAVVHTFGDPELVMHIVLPALYSSVYRLKCRRREKGKDFRVGPLRVRLLDAHLLPRSEQHAAWGLPIPEDVDSLPQRFAHVAVEIETWRYGTVVQAMLAGPHIEEDRALRRFYLFAAECGYDIAGPPEEEYLSGLVGDPHKVLVRYPVRRQAHLVPELVP